MTEELDELLKTEEMLRAMGKSLKEAQGKFKQDLDAFLVKNFDFKGDESQVSMLEIIKRARKNGA